MSRESFQNVNIIFDRLKSKLYIEKDVELAKMLAITPSKLGVWRTRNFVPLELLITLCREKGVDIHWLLTGKEREEEERVSAVAEGKACFIEGNAVEVHVYALGGAGMGKELVEVEPIETITVPQQFWKPSVRVVKVRGDSMEDYIHDGAFVGVDTADREILSGRVYAIWLPYEGTVLKELYTTPEAIIFRSRNKRYPDFSIPLKEFQVENIIGRVKWVLQET